MNFTFTGCHGAAGERKRVQDPFSSFAPAGRKRFSQRRKHARARGFLRPVGATEILAAPKARPRPAIPRGCNELYFYRMPVRGPRPTAWAATQGRPYDAATARLRAAAPRGSGDDAMKITFTGFCGAGDDPMNITFTSFLPARAPRPTAWAATQGRPYDGTTA